MAERSVEILFVGDKRSFEQLRDKLRIGVKLSVIHYGDGVEAQDGNTPQIDQHDWVIMDRRLVEASNSELESLDQDTPLQNIGIDRPKSDTDYTSLAANHARCGVEWSKQGVLQLRCALRGKCEGENQTINARRKTGISGGCAYEYLAPCLKKR